MIKWTQSRAPFLRGYFSCYFGYLFIEINVALYSDTKGYCVTITSITKLSLRTNNKYAVPCTGSCQDDFPFFFQITSHGDVSLFRISFLLIIYVDWSQSIYLAYRSRCDI